MNFKRMITGILVLGMTMSFLASCKEESVPETTDGGSMTILNESMSEETIKEEDYLIIGEETPAENRFEKLPDYDNMEDIIYLCEYLNYATDECWTWEFNKKNNVWICWKLDSTREIAKLVYYSNKAPDDDLKDVG